MNSNPNDPDRLEALDATSGVLTEIAAERQRQVDEYGWTPEHDDEHDAGEMADAAACYALFAAKQTTVRKWKFSQPPEMWPWAREWWSPTDKRRNLVKATALLVAEIERLDRVEDIQK